MGTDLSSAIAWLRAGGVVACPTDTFYGLAVDPTSPAAVRALFDLKGRAARAAVPLMAASVSQVEQCCGRLGPTAARLAARFWPGPLAIVLDAPAHLAPEVSGVAGSIAIRVPAHAVARALCEAWGAPLTATSANRTGEPPALAPGDVTLAGDDRLLIVDAGAAPGGPPSTIVDGRGAAPILVRAGAVPWNRVLESMNE
jgi:tRNA threonylcarbamoyl adenosine modification protein (Sua5/YciO/YrdC/YwlC family)